MQDKDERNLKIVIINDIYKNNLIQKYYLSLFSLKIPLIAKRYTNRYISYRLLFIIPITRKYGDYSRATLAHKGYKDILLRLKKQKSLRVAFLVKYDSMFPAKKIFEMMLLDSCFEPFIVVMPDTHRGEELLFYEMAKTYQKLSSSYSNVFQSYDFEKKEFIDFSSHIDIVYISYPYDWMTHKFYTINYLCQNALTILIQYSYTGLLTHNLDIYRLPEYELLWKIYIENQNTYNLLKNEQKKFYENLCIAGYPKMDELRNFDKTNANKEKKKIIIAPHCSVPDDYSFHLSNFVRLSEFFLELPLLYPQIDFIFRPHPLLFITLIRYKVYEQTGGGDSKEFVENYLQRIDQIPNMLYQEGGDYFETFATSDALIHDCGSFIAEYLYTDKPEAFIIQDKSIITQEFTSFGAQVLNRLYLVSTQKDIINFIDSVVLQGQDTMKESRLNFAIQNIRINHPNASQACFDDLKRNIFQN